MSRAFLHASADYVQFAPGNAANLTGGGMTSLFLWTPDVTAVAHGLIIARNATPATVWGVNPFSDNRAYYTAASSVATDTISAGVWYLLGFTKVAGAGQQVRSHFYNYTTGLWTHTNWGTLSDATTGPAASLRLGWFSGTDALTGKIAASALYNKVLTDLQIEALTTSFDDWLGQSPVWAVKLNQSSIATSVLDQSGGGGNQAAISGTTVSVSEPAGWSYGGWNLLDSGGVGFADGGTGHVYTFPNGAVANGDLLLLGIGSDTTVSTPAGWTATVSNVGSMGAYIFHKVAVGGETSVTIPTTGNFATSGVFLRYRPPGTIALDKTASAANLSSASTTPAVSTAALSNVGELSFAVAAAHGLGGATPTSPIWSAAYGARTEANSPGTSNTDTHVFAATNTNAGLAAQSPNCSWTNATNDQTILVATFTLAGAQTINFGQPTETDVALPFTGQKRFTFGQPSETDVALPFTVQERVNIGVATETDIALPFTIQKRFNFGIAVETDIPLPVRQPTKRTVHLQLNYANQRTIPDLTVDMNS